LSTAGTAECIECVHMKSGNFVKDVGIVIGGVGDVNSGRR
jgi:hypothetical protein